MNRCSGCGKENTQDTAYCLNCGSPLATPGTPKRKMKRKSMKKFVVVASLVAILLGVFIGYQVLNQKYSEASVRDNFLTALSEKDESTLKELIRPSNEKMKITHGSLNALFKLLDQNPSVFQEIKDSLSNDSLTNGLFTIQSKGKAYGIVPRYVIEPSEYLIEAMAVGDNTMILVDDQEFGYIEKSGDTNEYGPLLPGVYQFKTITMVGTEKVEEEVEVTLSGAQTKKALQFAKAEESKQRLELEVAEQKKNEEQKEAEEKNKEQQASEKVVVKEVIREVPVGGMYNYFLIPYSDYMYLTESDLSGMTRNELRLARNEIYARYGFVFESADLQNYFNTQAWYYPDPSYKGELSSVEKHNVDLIKSYE